MQKRNYLPLGIRGMLLLYMTVMLIACSNEADVEREPNPISNTTTNNNPVSTPNPGTFTGVIHDASGSPVTGALVKIRGVDTGVSFMVVSQEQGRYNTPKMLAGNYTLQVFGGLHQSKLIGPLEVGINEGVVADMIMSDIRVIPPPPTKMTNADYAQLMPEGEGKDLITSRCLLCHGLDRVVPARKSPQAWQITVNRMAYFLEERGDLGGPLSSEDQQTILDYVGTNLTRDTPRIKEAKATDPNQFLPRELLQGAEAKFVTMEFDPQTDVRNPETEFGVDTKGNAWVSEGGSAFFGRFDPTTLTYDRIESPPGNFPRELAQIAADPEDKIWVMDSGSSPASELLRYDPVTMAFKSFKIVAPLRYRAPLNSLVFLDGNIWGTGNASSRVVKVDPRTGNVTGYPATRGSHPFGITIGPDKAVWYLTNYNNEIVRLDPITGEQTPHKAKTQRSGLRRMGSDAVGNLWAAGQDSNNLVKLNAATGEVTEYSVPTENAGPYSADVDTTRNLIWFSERDANKLGRFDPGSETFVEFPLPTTGIEARRIIVDPVNPNRVWWNCSEGCSIGYTEVME